MPSKKSRNKPVDGDVVRVELVMDNQRYYWFSNALHLLERIVLQMCTDSVAQWKEQTSKIDLPWDHFPVTIEIRVTPRERKVGEK